MPVPLPAAELLYRVPPTKAYDGLFEDDANADGSSAAGAPASPSAAAAQPRSPALGSALTPARTGSSLAAVAQLFDPATLKQLYGQGQLGPVFASESLAKLIGSGEARNLPMAPLHREKESS